MEIIIKWKKATDEGYPRQLSVEIKTPVERETTDMENTLLGLPDGGQLRCDNGCLVFVSPQIDQPLETAPTDEQCITAIEVALLVARAKVAKCDRERIEREQREDAEAVARGQRYIQDPEHTGIQDYTVSQIDRVDPALADRVRAEKERRRAAEEEAQAQRRKKNEAAAKREASEKQKNQEARTSEKLAWIEQHGSPRLLLQVEAGLDGWPLYLHERLAADLPEGLDDYGGDQWELDNDGVNGDTLVNPSRQAVEMLIKSAARLVELKLEPDRKAALANLPIRRIEFPSDDDPDGYGCDETEVPSGIYLVYSSYRPGQHPGWSSKSIRIVVNQ